MNPSDDEIAQLRLQLAQAEERAQKEARKAQEEARARAELERARAELERNAQKEARARAELEQYTQKPLHREAAVNGLPPLGPYKGSRPSTPSISRTHESARIELRTFNAIPVNWKLVPRASSLQDVKQGWRSERTIQGYVRDVLKCLATELFGENMVIDQELTLLRLRPDIMVLVLTTMNAELPVGVCEVKVPRVGREHDSRDDVLDDPVVLGQLFNYLQSLRTFSGIVEVFGILSTYSCWRLCWLADDKSDAAAASTELREFSPPESHNREPIELQAIPELSPNTTRPATRPSRRATRDPEPIERKLYGTPIFSSQSPDLISYLGSALWKMATAEREPVVFANRDRPQLFTSQMLPSFSVAKLPETFSFHFEHLGRVKLNGKIFFMRDLGGGRDGRVWLAADENGVGFVVKFPTVEDDSDDETLSESGLAKAKEEANRWKTIWDLDTFVVTLAGMPGFIMPFLLTLKDDDARWNDRDIRMAIRAAVAHMVSAGFKHEDMARKHVGLFVIDGALRAAFMDLAYVKTIGLEEMEAAQSELLAALDLD